MKSIRECKTPEEDSWKTISVRILGFAKTFSGANHKVNLAQDTSNIGTDSSESEVETSRKRMRPKRFDISSDDEQEVSQRGSKKKMFHSPNPPSLKEIYSPTFKTIEKSQETLVETHSSTPEIMDNSQETLSESLISAKKVPLSTPSKGNAMHAMCSFEEKRKKRKYFLGDFEEEDMESPSKARRVLELAYQQQNVKSATIKRLKRENFRLTKKVASLQSLLQDIQNKLLITESAKSILEVSIQGTPAELLLSRLKKPGSKQEYPAELRAFALTLHFYSSKAYDYVRKNFQTCLPHPSTLRKWYQSIDGSPGFTDAALSALKMKVSEATKLNKTVICALIVDEMSIKKHIDWIKDKFIGYVDFGTRLDDDQLPVATEAYTFMLNCVNGHWKIPIGYFLINGLTAQERANIIQECLKIVHETGIEVVTLTLDGTSTNLSTIQYLGGSINASNLVYSFKHPISDNDIHVILDPCHMIKLVRNTLASKGSILYGQGRMIKWEYIESAQIPTGGRASSGHQSPNSPHSVEEREDEINRVFKCLESIQKDIKIMKAEQIKIQAQISEICNKEGPVETFKLPTGVSLPVETDIDLIKLNSNLRREKSLTAALVRKTGGKKEDSGKCLTESQGLVIIEHQTYKVISEMYKGTYQQSPEGMKGMFRCLN
ncbi:unnamed protein product [Larinioides sclopetarius]|uniref:DNA transposase THAP9 n=1 Tax=Larinioides sclopetarius TaxID=280406 RepID=A0AAV2ALD7_9ARAC